MDIEGVEILEFSIKIDDRPYPVNHVLRFWDSIQEESLRLLRHPVNRRVLDHAFAT